VRLGIIPAVISPFVLPKIGAHARRYFVTGERFDADTALHIGLVHEVSDTPDAVIDGLLDAILSSGPDAIRAAKLLIRQRPIGVETARIAAERRTSEEGQEGLRAFLDKRRASFVEERAG
jgi:methylglutaconyl-CoA hydratase